MGILQGGGLCPPPCKIPIPEARKRAPSNLPTPPSFRWPTAGPLARAGHLGLVRLPPRLVKSAGQLAVTFSQLPRRWLLGLLGAPFRGSQVTLRHCSVSTDLLPTPKSRNPRLAHRAQAFTCTQPCGPPGSSPFFPLTVAAPLPGSAADQLTALFDPLPSLQRLELLGTLLLKVQVALKTSGVSTDLLPIPLARIEHLGLARPMISTIGSSLACGLPGSSPFFPLTVGTTVSRGTPLANLRHPSARFTHRYLKAPWSSSPCTGPSRLPTLSLFPPAYLLIPFRS